MSDNSPQYLQGQRVDWAATEIIIDGQPYAAGFTSLDWKKAEHEGSAEMPFLNFQALVALLGGPGDDGLAYMVKEWTLTVTARHLNNPSIYTTRLERVRIVEDSGGVQQGSLSMVKLILSIMKIRDLPPA